MEWWINLYSNRRIHAYFAVMLFRVCIGAGMGWGLGYISPVSNLMKWFPDRRGLATGMALASFGGGSILAAPMNEYFMKRFFVAPDYLETLNVNVVTENGIRFVELAGEMKEVVAQQPQLKLQLPGELSEGVYVVGTGSTGVVETLLVLGSLHLAAMMTGTLLQRVPCDGWKPEGWDGDDTAASVKMKNDDNTELAVPVQNAMKTPQFWLIWAGVFGNAIAGVSVMACAKDIIGDVFATAFPAIITGAFMSGYISSLSAANGGGRLHGQQLVITSVEKILHFYLVYQSQLR